MRASFRRSGVLSFAPLVAVSIAALALPAAVLPGTGAFMGSALAQTKAPGGETAPKQIALTQPKIDSLIAAQGKIRDMESKQPQGKEPSAADDAKAQKDVDGIVKSSGFASTDEYADTYFTVGMVLSGMDPDGGAYIGTQAALKKQIDEVKADKKMPANEKKEALDELNAAVKSAATDKPMQGNIDLVKANFKKLSDSLQSGD